MECGLYLTSPPPQPDNLVLCAVGDESDLIVASQRLAVAGIRHRLITEPDLGDQATALATEPLMGDARKPLRRYPLWKPQHALDPQRVGTAPDAVLGGAIPSRSAIHAPVA